MKQTETGSNSPLRGMQDVPRNAWYVCAGREELGEKLLSRRILDVPLVMYRTSSGKPVAMHDRCPHRLMPLSLGTRLGDEIQCLYHGIQFNAAGACTKVPTQSAIPGQMAVETYPIVERGMYCWIWMGDPERMDPASIPDAGYLKPHYHSLFQFCYPIKASYLRLHENLMDTSHPSYLHAGFFDDGQLARSPFRLEKEGTMVRLIRDVGIHVPKEGTARFFNLEPGVAVHQTTITETYAPCLNTVVYRFTYPDNPTRPPVEFIAPFPVVPGGPRLCYQFMGVSTSWKLDAAAIEAFNAVTHEIMAGDRLALEAIEENLAALLPGELEVSIKADSPSLHLRHLIKSMTEAERKTRLNPVSAAAGDTRLAESNA